MDDDTRRGVPPDLPPERLPSVARAADEAGVDQLWVWEDCFKEAGISAAAIALASTERLTIGIGLMPAPLRNVALTAMEIATIERTFPGRLIPGVGHGVLSWMDQVGGLAASPMTLLREYTTALRSLLHGERLDVHGRYVTLTDVALDWPPDQPPPLVVGAVKPRTVALAGELADGVIFTGDTGPEGVATALPHFLAGREQATVADLGSVLTVFADVDGRSGAAAMATRVAEYVDAGATHVILHSVGDGPELEDFARMVGQEVGPLVG